jgi:hypothetical protein
VRCFLLRSSEMLTPKCPARDFRVSARENLTKNPLYRFKWNLGGQNLAGICEEIRLARYNQKLRLYQWLIVAVLEGYGEPVSGSNSLISGKIQGIFADLGSKPGGCLSFRYISQSLAAKFPTHENREFFGANREFGFRYQGTYAALFARLIVRDGPRA